MFCLRTLTGTHSEYSGRSSLSVAKLATCTLALLGSVATVPVHALDLFLTGYEATTDKGSYGFVSYIRQSRSEHEFWKNVKYRVWLDNVEYEYDSDDNTIFGRGPGLSIGLSYGKETDDYSWGFGTGLSYRNLSLSEPDPDSESVGAHTRLYLSAEGQRYISARWGIKAAASITPSNEGYWTQLYGFRRFGRYANYGLQFVAAGDSAYSAQKFGVLINGLQLGESPWVVSIGAGVQGDGSFDEQYVGITFVKAIF